MPGTKKKILIVEDFADQRALLEVALTHAGYAVVTATSGEQALADLKARGADARGADASGAHSPPVDLILLDVMLGGGMDGLDVLWKLKVNPATTMIPVMILSAHLTEQRIRELLATGAELYISKPYEIEVLLLTISHILAAHEARLVRFKG